MTDSNKPDHSADIAKIWATLDKVAERFAEVAAQNKENAARQKENEALSKESWKQILELKAQSAKTDAQMAENAAQMAKTDKEINKLLRSTKELHSNVRNEAEACEQRFVASLRRQKLVIAGVTFDEIYSNHRKDRKNEHIELDGLLVNGDSIAILEVKKRLHLNDVEKVRDNLIGRFRKLYPEHQNKRLMVLVAGENINKDAAAAALAAGFIVLSFKARRLQMQDEQLRYY